jgi:hypothetical protein
MSTLSRRSLLDLIALLRAALGLLVWAVIVVLGTMVIYRGASGAQYPTPFQIWAQPVPCALGLHLGLRVALGGGALPGRGVRLVPFFLLGGLYLRGVAGIAGPHGAYEVWVLALLGVALATAYHASVRQPPLGAAI